MDEGLKRRLVGATVLVSLVVIFLPMLLEPEPVVSTGIERSNIPPRPADAFSSSLLPLKSEMLSTPPAVKIAISELGPQAQIAGEEAQTKPEEVVKVFAPPSPKPRVGLSAWVIQVGSFSRRGNALKLVEQLQAKEFSAFMEQVSLKDKVLFRVRVGPEVDKEEAQRILDRLNQELQAQKLTGTLKSYP